MHCLTVSDVCVVLNVVLFCVFNFFPRLFFDFLFIVYLVRFHNKYIYNYRVFLLQCKFWKDQDVMFDCDADLTGTGNRSEFELESD